MASRDVRVLHRVDVDGAAVRMLRPAARSARKPAVEGGSVVGGVHAVVVRPVGLRQAHVPDREALVVESAHHTENRPRPDTESSRT